jgi:hypothetical protein
MPESNVTRAYCSAVLNHPMETVWSLIRDFNNYPAHIDGVSESVIEDDKRGDVVGAVRRFCYLGNWVRQRLVGHSDEQHSLIYQGSSRCHFRKVTCRNHPRRRATKAPCICVGSPRATAH